MHAILFTLNMGMIRRKLLVAKEKFIVITLLFSEDDYPAHDIDDH